MDIPSDPVDRNLRGQELERDGQEDDAIACYEANVRDAFDGTHPYERLAVIYRARDDLASEIRVLERALDVLRPMAQRPAMVKPYAKLTTRLDKAKQLAAKA